MALQNHKFMKENVQRKTKGGGIGEKDKGKQRGEE